MTSKLVKTWDGFKNIINGLGTEKDHRYSTYFYAPNRITEQQANDIYSHNWLAERVINVPVDDATKKWREFLLDDPNKEREIEDVMKAFDVKSKVNQAVKWARLFGGAVIIAVIEGEDLAEPLDVKKIRPNSLSNLIVLDKYNVYPESIDRNIMSKNFNKPEFYTVAREGQRIHHTRVALFQGDIPTIREWEQENYWGMSLLSKLWEPIKNSQTTTDSIGSLIYESNVDVYKIEGLNAMVAQGDDDLVIQRLKIAHEMKSHINGIAIDAADGYEKKSNTFASLAEIDDRFIQKVAGASGIPVTKLLGISPAGQNATGESDMRNYYDTVSSIQENVIRPSLDILDAIIMASEFGEYESPDYEFLPLQQLSEMEQAEVDLKTSQRDQTYINLGIINALDVLSDLSKRGVYDSIDVNRLVEERAAYELEETFEEPYGEEPDETEE